MEELPPNRDANLDMNFSTSTIRFLLVRILDRHILDFTARPLTGPPDLPQAPMTRITNLKEQGTTLWA